MPAHSQTSISAPPSVELCCISIEYLASILSVSPGSVELSVGSGHKKDNEWTCAGRKYQRRERDLAWELLGLIVALVASPGGGQVYVGTVTQCLFNTPTTPFWDRPSDGISIDVLMFISVGLPGCVGGPRAGES